MTYLLCIFAPSSYCRRVVLHQRGTKHYAVMYEADSRHRFPFCALYNPLFTCHKISIAPINRVKLGLYFSCHFDCHKNLLFQMPVLTCIFFSWYVYVRRFRCPYMCGCAVPCYWTRSRIWRAPAPWQITAEGMCITRDSHVVGNPGGGGGTTMATRPLVYT